MGIVYALLSLAFAGVNDFLFKHYIREPDQPLGRFVAGVGMVWTAVFGTAMLASGAGVDLAGWRLSLAAGLASVSANLLLIHSLRRISAGTGATIYRLNLIVVAVMGVAFLREEVNAWKGTGVVLGATSALLLGNTRLRARPGHAAMVAALCLAMACVLRATMGILYRLYSVHELPPYGLLTIGGLCWLGGGLLYGIARGETAAAPRRVWRYSLASGLLVCGIVYFMLQATRFGEASVVIPVAQLSFVLTAILGMLFHEERFGWSKALALAAAAGCVAALARS